MASDFGHTPRRQLPGIGLAGFAALLGTANAATTAHEGPSRPGAGGMTVDVTQFGAIGDGVTDDAPAINAAIAAVRERHKRVSGYDLGCRIVFPAGIYAVNASINLTALRNINTVIDGSGSAVVGRCAGKPVIDALGSRWLTVRDLTVLGDSAAVPDNGIQIGLAMPHVVADVHRFENVKVLGHFSRACLYNRSGETTGFHHLLLWNEQAGGFCLVQDGVNHFGVTSSFVNVDIPTDTPLGFGNNEFINCDFRHGAGGTPVWLGDTARHAFIRCYATTTGGPAFILHCDRNSHRMLDVDCHCETSELSDVFLLTGRPDRIIVRGISYRDHLCFANGSVFRRDDRISHVELQNARLEVTTFANPACRVFGEPDRFRATGTFYSADTKNWNGDGVFTGFVTTGGNVAFCGTLPATVQVREEAGSGTMLPNSAAGALFRDSESGRLMTWSTHGWIDALGRKE